MSPLPIIEHLHVLKHRAARLAVAQELLLIHLFHSERGHSQDEEVLDRRIVEAIIFATYTAYKLAAATNLVGATGALAPTIAVMHDLLTRGGPFPIGRRCIKCSVEHILRTGNM